MKKYYEQPAVMTFLVSDCDVISTSMLIGDEASRVKDIYDFNKRFGQ